MYLLRFFFRSFSLSYPLSCGILFMILVNYIAHGDGSPPAKFTRIIFVYLSLSSHWYHLLVLEFPNLFRSAFSFFVRFVSGFIIADFSVLFFNWHELWLWWHEFFLFIFNVGLHNISLSRLPSGHAVFQSVHL